eukprot:6190495-Pleurochrysis_carterae.AAC.1
MALRASQRKSENNIADKTLSGDRHGRVAESASSRAAVHAVAFESSAMRGPHSACKGVRARLALCET